MVKSNYLDFGIGWCHQQLAAVEADAPEDLHCLGQEPWVEDRLGQVYVTKVPRALSHVPCKSLAPACPVHGPLPGVHQPTQLWPPSFIHLRELDTTLSDAHSPDLLRPQDSKLDPLHLLHGGFGVPRDDRHLGCLIQNSEIL